MRSRNLVIGVVSSVVVVAVAIGLLLLLGPRDGDDDALPERVGDRVATDVAATHPDLVVDTREDPRDELD